MIVTRLLGSVAVVGVLGIGSAVDAGRPVPNATGCEDIGDTTAAVDGFPGRMSTLLGSDISTGRHDCFERVVLELGGTGDLPGYSVQYQADPIVESPSGETLEVAGDATLVLSVGAWMTDTEGNGYDGPSQITPTNVDHILQLRLIENHEGQHQWAIGLDRERGFRVSTLADPTRIVVDVERDEAAGPASSAPPTDAPETTLVETTEPATTPAPATTQAPTTTSSTAAPTTAAPQPSEPGVSTVDHPLVGAWVLTDQADPAPTVVAFSSDGVYQQTDVEGSSGYGSWEATGATTAALTFRQHFVQEDGSFASSIIRAVIQVGLDGQTFTAQYTLELNGVAGAPVGQHGPGAATATRIAVEPMGSPVAPLADLFSNVGDTAPPTSS